MSVKRAEEVDGDGYAAALEEALAAGRRWGHHPWMRATARTLAVVLDEMLDQREDAERVVTTIAGEVHTSPNLEDELAIIAFNRQEYATALSMWQRILPDWRSDELYHDMQPVLSARCAGVAAGHLGKWDVAADFFGRAIERSSHDENRPWLVGLLGDRAYALWQSGARKAAVAVCGEVVEALEKMANKPESFAEYAVQRLVGHILAYLAVQGEAMTPPVPGMCSSLSPSERLAELPPTPTAYAWFLVYRLARMAGEEEFAAGCVERFRTAPFAFLRLMAARDALERRVRVGDLEGVFGLAMTAAMEMERSVQRRGVPLHAPDPPELLAGLTEGTVAGLIWPTLWASIAHARASAMSIESVVAGWLAEADPNHALLVQAVELCQTQSEKPVGELTAILMSHRAATEERILAAVLLLGRDDTGSDDALYAQTIVLNSAKEYELFQDIAGESVDALVRRDWLRFCANRFLLRSPGIHANTILDACGSTIRGWSAAARIILTAVPTTRLNLPESMQRTLTAIAEKRDSTAES